MAEKVNKGLYAKVKGDILAGDYTVEEVSTTLQWIRMEYANKRNEVVARIKARDVEAESDSYPNGLHKYENGPDRE